MHPNTKNTQIVGGRRHRVNKHQNDRNELLARIAYFMEMCMDPNVHMIDESDIKRDNRNYNSHEQQFTMTTQKKKVGKSVSPNRVNRSKHSIGQPRSTGGNH